jgi:nucleosome binding factor SPN SPT16 subunit
MKELKEQEEADLVVQEKLVRTKNERVPRLADLTMRPVVAGRIVRELGGAFQRSPIRFHSK